MGQYLLLLVAAHVLSGLKHSLVYRSVCTQATSYFKYDKTLHYIYNRTTVRCWVLLLFPYIHGVTEPIKRILCSHNVKVAQKPFLTLNHIFAKPKDPVPKEQKSDAIYSIPCNDCNQEYIGQTKRQFGTRLKENQKAVSLSKKDNSALSEHRLQINHTIAWDNSKLSPPIDDTIKDVVWKLGT